MNRNMMYEGFAGGFGGFTGLIPLFAFGVLLFTLWSVFWKGVAMWHAGRRGHARWFVALLILNTGGILDIIYLFFILKLKLNDLFSK